MDDRSPTTKARPTQARVLTPPRVRAGQAFRVSASILHPMITGHQNDDQGRRQVREIVSRFECRSEDGLLMAVDLQPALAANPSLSFWLSLARSTTLEFTWRGDAGFFHRHVQRVDVER